MPRDAPPCPGSPITHRAARSPSAAAGAASHPPAAPRQPAPEQSRLASSTPASYPGQQ